MNINFFLNIINILLKNKKIEKIEYVFFIHKNIKLRKNLK